MFSTWIKVSGCPEAVDLVWLYLLQLVCSDSERHCGRCRLALVTNILLSLWIVKLCHMILFLLLRAEWALDSITRCLVPASTQDELRVLSVLKTNPWGSQPCRLINEAQFYCSLCLEWGRTITTFSFFLLLFSEAPNRASCLPSHKRGILVKNGVEFLSMAAWKKYDV